MKETLLTKMIRKLSLLSLTVLLIFTIQSAYAEGGAIFFSESEYTVPVGWNGKTITPSTQGINSWIKYEYYSEDESIAVVSDAGYVRGISGGTTVIHCKGVNPTTKEEYEASYALTVTIPVSNLSVEQKNVTLGVTDIPMEKLATELVEFFYHTPNVTIVPENATIQTLHWSSSNESVATVDQNGVIKAIKPGSAVITGKVTDGGWASVQININVPKTFVSATSIRLTSKEPVLFGCDARSGSGQIVGTYITPYGIRHVNDRWDFGTTGNCFTLESANQFKTSSNKYDDDSEVNWYYIVPTAAGQGAIRYIVNGSTVFSVSVTVDKSAVE